jgi:hypothetical protein
VLVAVARDPRSVNQRIVDHLIHPFRLISPFIVRRCAAVR